MQLGFLSSTKHKLSSKAQATLDDHPVSSKKQQPTPTKEAMPTKEATPTKEAVPATNYSMSKKLKVGGRNTHSNHGNISNDDSVVSRDNANVVSLDSHLASLLTPEDELEQLMKEWISPVYAFFKSKPCIIQVDKCHAHDFKCVAKGCKVKVHQYADMKDACSTSSLHRQVKVCKGWREEVLKAADKANNAMEVSTKVIAHYLQDSTITTIFEQGKKKTRYSNYQHTHGQMR